LNSAMPCLPDAALPVAQKRPAGANVKQAQT